jgi:hypothetical protein
MINTTIQKKENLSSNAQYRQFLQANAKSIRQFNEHTAGQACANYVATKEQKPVKISTDLKHP